MNRLPLELSTRIFDFAVDHGSEQHAEQIIPLTHVCRYWRTTLLSYPKIWSVIRMKPGDLAVIPEWLARSQKAPLTVIAKFADSYEHPPCRYQDSATATLADKNDPRVCHRHDAVLSLDQLLPHRSRIRDLTVFLDSSDPDWDDEDNEHEGEPTLLRHRFFSESLPNLQRLDFRAAHAEHDRYAIPIPISLFARDLPRLKELLFLGVIDGLTGTVKNLTSCEIGYWSESAGPTIMYQEELHELLDNNKTLQSLTINWCEFFNSDPQVPTAIPLTDLKFLKVTSFEKDLDRILDCIHAPQFKNLDTVQLFFDSCGIKLVATDSSGHTFEFSEFDRYHLITHPLQRLGAKITTLRLSRVGLDIGLGFLEPIQTLDTIQVLEFDAAIANSVQNFLSASGILPGLKVIRVGVSGPGCEGALRILAATLRQRMDQGNPLAAIEPLPVGFSGELDQSLRVKWEECYKAEGMQKYLFT